MADEALVIGYGTARFASSAVSQRGGNEEGEDIG